jgi:hypothetical protein
MTDRPGLIGVVAQETARYAMFSASLTGTEKPDGSRIRWAMGHSIAQNHNLLVHMLLEQPEWEWLWILGDDHAWKPDLLMQLLAHDKDIVVPLCLMRSPPYHPVIFSGFENEELFTRTRIQLPDLDIHAFGGLIPVHSCGGAGMLVKRQVFEEMPEPWFEAAVLNGQTLGEDLYFCDKARDLGFEIYCDLDHTFGHCMNGIVWPARDNVGQFTYGFSMTGGFAITMPRLDQENEQ